jgi:excisionase family DNA binding protein
VSKVIQPEHAPRVRQRQQTLSVAEAAEILGISRSSAFQAANNGQLPVIRIGKRLLVSLHSLEQILGGSVDVGPSESSQ